jgi:hypothetical protein
MSPEMCENDRPHYKRAIVIEMELSARDTEHGSPPEICSGSKATAHLKAIAHVSPNLV